MCVGESISRCGTFYRARSGWACFRLWQWGLFLLCTFFLPYWLCLHVCVVCVHVVSPTLLRILNLAACAGWSMLATEVLLVPSGIKLSRGNNVSLRNSFAKNVSTIYPCNHLLPHVPLKLRHLVVFFFFSLPPYLSFCTGSKNCWGKMPPRFPPCAETHNERESSIF
ncbi:unnamed protein product [Discosporangium mesarthrocarpum]